MCVAAQRASDRPCTRGVVQYEAELGVAISELEPRTASLLRSGRKTSRGLRFRWRNPAVSLKSCGVSGSSQRVVGLRLLLRSVDVRFANHKFGHIFRRLPWSDAATTFPRDSRRTGEGSRHRQLSCRPFPLSSNKRAARRCGEANENAWYENLCSAAAARICEVRVSCQVTARFAWMWRIEHWTSTIIGYEFNTLCTFCASSSGNLPLECIEKLRRSVQDSVNNFAAMEKLRVILTGS